MSASNTPVLVLVYAHPDDEVFSAGGTMARFASVGRVVLICATRGEMGEISDPALATPEILGSVRERELREACALLGVDDVRFLGYRDSGMAGTDANDDPRAFMRASRDEVVATLVRMFRELAPAIVVTFDESGGYGHPDHIAIHHAATEAFDAASDPAAFPEAGPAVELGRLCYSGFPRSLFRAMVAGAEAAGIEPGPLRDIDLDRTGLSDDDIDVAVDVREFFDLKLQAMRAHRTQVADENIVDQMPEEVRTAFVSSEYYQVVRGPLPEGQRPGRDLLAGLDTGGAET